MAKGLLPTNEADTMPLPEYKNLTESELIWADHCAETGNVEGLRGCQRLSASREGRDAHQENTSTYAMPMQPRKL